MRMASSSSRSFPVRGPDAQVALIAHVVPIRRSARDLISQSVGVLILMPAKTPQAPSVELVQSLFDLTAAEARVARSLTMGQTVDEIASEKGVSSHTVRSQVRGVLGEDRVPATGRRDRVVRGHRRSRGMTAICAIAAVRGLGFDPGPKCGPFMASEGFMGRRCRGFRRVRLDRKANEISAIACENPEFVVQALSVAGSNYDGGRMRRNAFEAFFPQPEALPTTWDRGAEFFYLHRP